MIKYLPNDKKVSVVGKVNKNEYIVQEIFVTDDGSEIPCGENFTSKTVLDSPVESWLDRSRNKLEQCY